MPMEPRYCSLQPSGPQATTSLLTRFRSSRSAGRPSKYQIPACTLISLLRSTTFPNAVLPLHIDSLVDGLAIDFHPGMRFERNFLRSQHQLGGNSRIPKEAGGNGGALQTVDSFGIPYQRVVHRLANAINRVAACIIGCHGPLVNDAMQARKITAESQKVESHQAEECLPKEKFHLESPPFN